MQLVPVAVAVFIYGFIYICCNAWALANRINENCNEMHGFRLTNRIRPSPKPANALSPLIFPLIFTQNPEMMIHCSP